MDVDESQAMDVDESANFNREHVDDPVNPATIFISMWRSIFKKYKHHHVC